MPKVYEGTVEGDHFGARVTVRMDEHHELLAPRLDLRNHSPDGFAWGYGGSGPAQLALAILADATRDDKVAMRYYQVFKELVVSKIPADRPFRLTARAVRNWVVAQEQGESDYDIRFESVG